MEDLDRLALTSSKNDAVCRDGRMKCIWRRVEEGEVGDENIKEGRWEWVLRRQAIADCECSRAGEFAELGDCRTDSGGDWTDSH